MSFAIPIEIPVGITRFERGRVHAGMCDKLKVKTTSMGCELELSCKYGGSIVAGMGQANVEEFGLAVEGEAALRPFVLREREGLMAGTPESVVEALSTLLPAVDRQLLGDEVGADLIANLQGGAEVPNAWIDDDLAFTRHWGFELEDVAVPVSFWQGSEDLMVPQAHMGWQAERVPGAVVHLEAGEGHLSLMVANFGRMLDEAVQHL